jgi:hypothetical protein
MTKKYSKASEGQANFYKSLYLKHEYTIDALASGH